MKNEAELTRFIADNYLTQIKNFFEDDRQAMKFLSSMRASVQKNPKLMECSPVTVINSFMTMAQLGLMPSDISGEAFVLPYAKNKKVGDAWEHTLEAQFQLGYQGIITLLYRAGVQSIRSEIVRKNDKFSMRNGIIDHEIDVMKSNEERGEAVAAYVIATLNGQELSKAMNKKDILDMGRKFSKSFGGKHTPWDEVNDPELWMWKKTVLKQLGKMLPKNETISKAIAEDNKDSIISDRLEQAKKDTAGLKMGNLLENANKETGKKAAQEQGTDAEGPQVHPEEGGATIE